MYRVLIAMPAYNEESTIREVLRRVRRYTGADILVVNDGSTDSTLPEVLACDVTYVISHDCNRGPGAALRTAFLFALEQGYDVLITLDADGQHDPVAIPRFLEAIADADLVIGSRYLPTSEKRSEPPPGREEAARYLTALVRRYTGYTLTDCASGFRAYRASALRHLNLTENGYAWPFQLWIQADKADLRVKEIPVPLIYLDYRRDARGEFRSLQEAVRYCHQVMRRERSGESQGLPGNLARTVLGKFQQISDWLLTIVVYNYRRLKESS